MEDAIKSIKAYLYDRESSPLTGAYLISWCIWNFKFILIIFSSDTIHIKFLNIESYLFEPSYFFDYSQWLGPIWVYFIPLGLALLYLIVLPKFSIKIYEISLENRKKLNEKKQKFETQRLLTEEESINIRRKIYKISEEYEVELKKKDETISELKHRIEEFQKITSIPPDREAEPTKNQPILESLSSEAREILLMACDDKSGEIVCYETLDGFSMSAGKKEIIPKSNRETSKLKSAVIELENTNLIAPKGNKRVIFEVTSLGYEIADLIRLT